MPVYSVYYKKPCPGSDIERCYCCGFDPNPELTIADVLAKEPRAGFPKFAQVKDLIVAKDIDHVFHNMQGEVWSPNGEARELIRSLGLWHTSMSVGDVVLDFDGEKGWQCDRIGWIELPKGAR